MYTMPCTRAVHRCMSTDNAFSCQLAAWRKRLSVAKLDFLIVNFIYWPVQKRRSKHIANLNVMAAPRGRPRREGCHGTLANVFFFFEIINTLLLKGEVFVPSGGVEGEGDAALDTGCV